MHDEHVYMLDNGCWSQKKFVEQHARVDEDSYSLKQTYTYAERGGRNATVQRHYITFPNTSCKLHCRM